MEASEPAVANTDRSARRDNLRGDVSEKEYSQPGISRPDGNTNDTPTDGPDDPEKADGVAVHATISRGSQLPMSKARTIALVITLTGAAFLNTLSVQAAVIVLPTIGRDLHIPAARQQWIVSAYSLTFGCFLMLWGKPNDGYIP